MLVEFKIENFRSFQSEQTFSMVASKDDAHPHNLIECDKLSLVKTAAIYGPNASGKSTLINALKAMQRFVTTSATQMNIGDQIDCAVPFRLDNESESKPSRFEVTLLLDGTTYYYGFSATAERVCEETLDVRKAGGRISHWFDRQFDSATGQTAWKINGPLKHDAELLRTKTRDNGLLLSRGAEFNLLSLTPLFLWFRQKCRILDLSETTDQLGQTTAEMLETNAEYRPRILELMRDADFGICDIQVQKESVPKLPRNASGTSFHEPLRRACSEFRVTSYHESHECDKRVQFRFEEDESNGTQRFFALVGPILKSLAEGTLLIIDELDCSMHPLLTRKVIELFQSREANPRGAQMIFTTHDSSMMDSSLFRRDQIWLIEKHRHGDADLYSLYDFAEPSRPRKWEALEKNYFVGRYGGVPMFGPSLEYLEYQDVP